MGNYGVEAAAQFYFGKHAREVTLAEAAMLAGLPKAPTRLAPTKNLDLAQARAKLVLDGMVDAGFLGEEDAEEALAEPAAIAETEAKDAANYFVDWATEELWQIAEANDAAGWRGKNLIVRTTYDPVLQIKAELAVMNALDNAAEASHVSQAALVALDPTGAVRAMVGGRSYAQSQFNRATQALRQPGSAFKPIVYLTALEQGFDPNTVMWDGPISVDGWAPENNDGTYQGQVTLVQALAHSINTVTVQLSEQAGRHNVIDTAHRLGITEKIDPVPSIALGTTEVTVLELAGAYLPFINDGYPEHPYGITQVKTEQGDVLFSREREARERVIASRYVGLMNYMLDQVMAQGTGRAALLAGGRPAAGKTGTSQDNRDAWFVGFTPQLLTAVWLGNDDSSPMDKVYGGGLAARLWKDFMDRAHRGAPMLALNMEAPETTPIFTVAGDEGYGLPQAPRRRCFLFFCKRD
jgi:penicillin-binding protein 1A